MKKILLTSFLILATSTGAFAAYENDRLVYQNAMIKQYHYTEYVDQEVTRSVPYTVEYSCNEISFIPASNRCNANTDRFADFSNGCTYTPASTRTVIKTCQRQETRQETTIEKVPVERKRETAGCFTAFYESPSSTKILYAIDCQGKKVWY